MDSRNEEPPVTLAVRAWLADRPGALGAVASRIGAVGGDVVGIEILERGAGRAIDEIIVQLPSATPADLLVREVNEVDGVDVEEVRRLDDGTVDPWLDAVETAAQLVGAGDEEELLETLCDRAHRAAGALWAVVIVLEGGVVVASRGEVPSRAWLAAFVEGSRASARNLGLSTDDVTWVPLPATGMALVLGREGTVFRAKERRHAAALARVADAWLRSVRERSALACRLAHPARRAQARAQPLARPTARPQPT
ncbi:MAG: hypothetical protein GEV08_06695 [Acidimicrobiia bacterium]|nr:hypothetical protein [Acidimicrobiia bacterium]